jgi:hypothetical protein
MDTANNHNLHLATTQLEEKAVLISTNPTDTPQTESQTLLINGGVTILAIIALSYFTKTLIQSIANLLKIWKK